MNNTNLQHWLVRFLEAYIDLESFFDPLIDSHIASSPTFTKVLSVRKCVAQRKLRGYVEFYKFDDTIKKNKKFV